MVKCVCVNIVSFTLLLCMLAVTGRTVRGMMVASTTSTSAARAATTKRHRNTIVFHWFRHGDLRLDDNPALVHSSQLAAAAAVHGDAHVVPIFCFDDQKFFGSAVATPSQSWKCGPRRAKFIVESVSDLRAQLQASNSRSQLLVARGDPATIFDKLLTQLTKTKVDDVSIVCQEEVVQEERDAVQSVAAILKKHYPCRSATTATTTTTSSKVHCIWGSTMYDLKDLPYAAGLTDMPDVFTPFRTKVEQKSAIAKPLPVPNKLPFPPATSIEYQSIFIDHMTYMPTLQDLGYTDDDIRMAEDMDPRGVMTFEGGATSGLRRVKEYIWDRDLLRNYFDTRNGMIGPDYSTKFSPWLAHGCLSPRRIVQECQRYERERVANKSTYWVIFELLWRDYCKFFAVKHGNAIFFPGGTTGRDKKWQEGAATAKTLEAWKEGRTGFPLVDANMREMKATGFMSNRGRQNVASFLAIDLAQDWRRGGDWFESQLIDYDVYSNWVNWCSAAGMTGGRLNRFNIVKQSKDYDQHGDYVRRWLPELKDVPTEFVHEPWKMTQFQQIEFNVRLGVDYPHPIIPPSRPYTNGGGDAQREVTGGNKRVQGKTRRPNNNNRNRHQKYDMKSLKEGSYKQN